MAEDNVIKSIVNEQEDDIELTIEELLLIL
jgi:hypothetical protein